MNRRLVAAAALFRETALPVVVLTWLAISGAPGSGDTGETPIVGHLAPSLSADVTLAGVPKAIALDNGLVPSSSRTADTLTETTIPPGSASVVTASPPVPSEQHLLETSPEQTTKTTATSLENGDTKPGIGTTEVPDGCLAMDSCVDQYLWALYQRAPKEDSIGQQEQSKIAVRKKGKLVTVVTVLTTAVEEDFTWKDPKAAEKAGMPLMDYVIGGIDRDFKRRLFQMLHAAADAGLSPGITSGFRDDYRQSIASGLKAASNRSYHGGSLRGGYGHGLAADIVSTSGATHAQRLASSRALWKWIDTYGKDFGLARPYLDRDPPHVAPLDGKEYADHRLGQRTRQAGTTSIPQRGSTLSVEHVSAKRARTARSSKVRTL